MDVKLKIMSILAESKDWMSAAAIGTRLNLSDRTVRKYIQEINKGKDTQDMIEASRRGYRVLSMHFQQYIQKGYADFLEYAGPKERINKIIQSLVKAKEDGVDIYALSEELYISDATIKQDLKRIKRTIAAYGLSIEMKNDVCYLNGLETDKRKLIKETLYQEANNNINDLFSKQDILIDQEVSFIKDTLYQILDDAKLQMNDYAFHNLLLHLIIMIDRLKGGAFIPDSDLYERKCVFRDTKEYQIASSIMRKMMVYFHFTYYDSEVDFLTLQLIGNTIDVASEAREYFLSPAYLTMTKAIVKKVNHNFLIDLTNDEFITRFSVHLENMVNRIHNGIRIHNSMLRDLQLRYPLTYDLAVYIAKLVEEYENIVVGEEETGYVAVHIGSYIENQKYLENKLRTMLICPKYYDFHKEIKKHLEKVFEQDLAIIKVITDLSEPIDFDAADLILTTENIGGSYMPNAVKILPFLGDADIGNIRDKISFIRQSKAFENKQEYIRKYIRKELFFRNIPVQGKEALIICLCYAMESQGIVDATYQKSVLEREQAASTVFNNVAVPHSIHMDALQSGIGIVLYDDGFYWDDNKVDIVAIIAINNEERELFGEIFELIISVLADEKNIAMLKKAKNYEEFISLLLKVVALSLE